MSANTRLRSIPPNIEKVEGNEISLDLAMITLGNSSRNIVPAYRYRIVRNADGQTVGRISLRVGDTKHLRMYGGHIGYGVDEPYRGHKYAGKAVKLILDVARANGFKEVWITTNPDNIASRKTCEWVGAEYVEEVPVPPDTDLYRQGDTRKCRYLIKL
ncbi:MAG: GNAT family N-acetyltransferase [Candidatus Sumerlaeota bacterium]